MKISIVINEMQITVTRHPFTPTRVARMKKIVNLM